MNTEKMIARACETDALCKTLERQFDLSASEIRNQINEFVYNMAKERKMSIYTVCACLVPKVKFGEVRNGLKGGTFECSVTITLEPGDDNDTV